MNNALLLRLHRWTTLTFALPLAFIVLTGLILSFEPLVQTLSLTPGSLDAARIESLIQRHDPDGKARGLVIDPYSQRLRFQGGAEIDLTTGELAPSPSRLAAVFQWSRRTHERLIGLGWLVTACTIAMLLLMTFGILMGLPKLRNSLSGWHKATAWFTLPVLILSPLTGLFLAFGLTFQGAGLPRGGAPIPLHAAVRLVAQSHDLSNLLSLGPRGGRFMARMEEGGQLRTYQVSAQGVTELPRNWPRLIHEGNWSSLGGSLLNILISAALIALLVTGILLWARRTLRRRRSPRAQDAAPSANAFPASAKSAL